MNGTSGTNPTVTSLLPLVVLSCVGIALSLMAGWAVKQLDERQLHAEHQRASLLALNALELQIKTSAQVLAGMKGLYLASEFVSREEFAIYANQELKDNPAIQALEWIPRVRQEERLRYERQAREQGAEGFRLVERSSSGSMVPVEPRPEYFPVFYVEPLAGNEAALGFDLASNADRRMALQQARDSGEITATAPITLVQEDANQRGVLLFLPLYEGEPRTVADRRQLLLGFVLGVFRVGDMFTLSTASLQEELVDIRLSLFDVTESAPQILLSTNGQSNEAQPAASLWLVNHPLDIADRQWVLRSHASEAFVAGNRGRGPVIAVLMGALLTLLVAGYFRVLRIRESKIRQLVAERTGQLMASEHKNRTIVETAINAIIAIDQQGHITLFNAAAEHMFGYKADDVMGRNVKMLMPEVVAAHHDGYIDAHLKTGQSRIIGIGREVEGRKASGDCFPAHLSIGRVELDDGTFFIGMLSDISRQKAAEQALIDAKDHAEAANRQKSAFLNMMSHELRTPLTVILGYLPLLQNSKALPEPELIHQIANDMDVSGQHLLELINDLLDISKIEAGQMTLTPMAIELEPFVASICNEFAAQAKEKQLALSYDAPPVEIVADRKRLRQILINLVGNALKFTLQGQIEIKAALKPGHVEISVIDTGIGIDAGDMDHVFDAFRQVDNSSTRQVGGSGLGLAITKRLVNLHGGDIRVISEPGKGSEFSFTLAQPQERLDG